MSVDNARLYLKMGGLSFQKLSVMRHLRFMTLLVILRAFII